MLSPGEPIYGVDILQIAFGCSLHDVIDLGGSVVIYKKRFLVIHFKVISSIFIVDNMDSWY